MVTRAARNQKAYRERVKLFRAEKKAIVRDAYAELLANVGVPDTDPPSGGIRVSVSATAFSIDFHWRGPRGAYDKYEARCNALGFTFEDIRGALEQDIVKWYLEQLQLKERGG